jgi:hypothetical protein
MVRFDFARGSVLAFAMAALVNGLTAQKMSVTPGVGLSVGGTAHINFEDPGKAGQSVTVRVSGGFPVVTVYDVVIELDAKGKGHGSWTVVGGWRSAFFDGPGVAGVGVAII